MIDVSIVFSIIPTFFLYRHYVRTDTGLKLIYPRFGGNHLIPASLIDLLLQFLLFYPFILLFLFLLSNRKKFTSKALLIISYTRVNLMFFLFTSILWLHKASQILSSSDQKPPYIDKVHLQGDFIQMPFLIIGAFLLYLIFLYLSSEVGKKFTGFKLVLIGLFCIVILFLAALWSYPTMHWYFGSYLDLWLYLN